MKSKILRLFPKRDHPDFGYGFIVPNSGHAGYYFDNRNLVGCKFSDLSVDSFVEFTLIENESGYVAKDIRLNSKKKEKSVLSNKYKETIKSIKEMLKNSIDSANHVEFEDISFLVLKLLGLHNIFQYDRSNQAGKPDGFFAIRDLAVLYDCTLHDVFFEYKEEQINNFVGRIRDTSEITINIGKPDGSTYLKTFGTSKNDDKQIWIITRGISKIISDIDDIKVKEVSVYDLLALLETRSYEAVFNQASLAQELSLIGERVL